jgi:hypothetical protein
MRAVCVLVATFALALPAAAATRCRDCRHVHDCGIRTCCVRCASPHAEMDLRRAVARANACAGVPGFRRTIGFATDGPCTIDMRQTSPLATCPQDPGTAGRGSVCLRGRHITIDGENAVTFNYAGTVPCRDCAGSCTGTVQPGLFTLRGRGNTV